MRLIPKILLLTVICWLGSCLTDDDTSQLTFTPDVIQPTAQKKQSSPKSLIAALEAVVPRGSKKADILMDVFALLDADELIAQNNTVEALKKLREALVNAKGRFSRITYKKWVRFYFAQLGKRVDPAVAAQLVWAETGKGKIVDYWNPKKVKGPKDIEAELRKIIPQHLVMAAAVEKNDKEDVYPSDKFAESDPMLKAHARVYCKNRDDPKWEAWVQALGERVQLFWAGRVFDCEQKFQDAAQAYEEFFALAMAQEKIPEASFALTAAYRLTAIYRWIDRRQSLADAYSKLILVWRNGKASREVFDKNEVDFKLRQVNDLLWAARYRALVGDFDLAENFANDAAKKAEALDDGSIKVNSRAYKTVKEYRAEAHHVLAYRIGIEQGRIESSRAQMALGLEIEGLSEAWLDRLKWYKAFYAFMDGDYEKARHQFEELLNDLDDSHDYRTKIYYWLSMTYRKLDRQDEANFYLKALASDYPVSYYTVVAQSVDGTLNPQKFLEKKFGTKASLMAKLREKKKFALQNIKQKKPLNRLLTRAQLLTKARITYYGLEAVKELTQATARVNLTTEEEIYLSRLQFVAGDYFGAVSRTTALARSMDKFWEEYPEQLLIYFPVAHIEEIRNHSLEYGLEPEDILAVIRQESTFRGSIGSPAGAQGLMQLMPSTAKRLVSSLSKEQQEKFPVDKIASLLKDPDFNILLGTKLIKKLFDKYQGRRAPSYASYNAGEFVVDIWLERRRQENVMLWIETMPFSETAGYVKNVWRNYHVYKYLNFRQAEFAQLVRDQVSQ